MVGGDIIDHYDWKYSWEETLEVRREKKRNGNELKIWDYTERFQIDSLMIAGASKRLFSIQDSFPNHSHLLGSW